MEICSDTKEFISAFNQFEKEGLFEHIHQPAFYCLKGWYMSRLTDYSGSRPASSNSLTAISMSWENTLAFFLLASVASLD